MDYNHIKAIHIIFVVSWFAGLFYLPRLFVYHTEANDKPDLERKIIQEQFQKMEKILFNAIMIPAMWLTLLTGATMVYWSWWDTFSVHGWLHLKLGFVAVLLLYHLVCRQIIKELRVNKFRFTGFQLRLYNEIATILLFAIVFLVVLKNTVDWLWGIAGLMIFAVLIMSAVKIVKSIREKKKA
ncbi:CopD family protein [Flectobacillus major]|uniref:CopD family protein n=1 Tax=Flectobacillus major TaxID=103 RepID=UPI0004251045|nr:CopD family protein [Flectobacillus major]